MNRDPDAIKMAAFKEGDKAAFRVLFDTYKKKIINFCYRFCGNRETAEEMAQEVFLRVYKAASTYSPDAKFSTWIYRIAVNVCLNELRRPGYRYKTESVEGRMKNASEWKGSELADPSGKTPDGLMEKIEQERIIMENIQRLPDKQRAALLLVNEGCSYQEIAQQINQSESGVKSLIHRARETLKESLKELLKE